MLVFKIFSLQDLLDLAFAVVQGYSCGKSEANMKGSGPTLSMA